MPRRSAHTSIGCLCGILLAHPDVEKHASAEFTQHYDGKNPCLRAFHILPVSQAQRVRDQCSRITYHGSSGTTSQLSKVDEGIVCSGLFAFGDSGRVVGNSEPIRG
jgi:hypothetical protein